MPTPHCNFVSLTRTNRQNAVDHAAYMNRSHLTDKTTGKHHNYSHKGICLYSEITLPVNPPPWLQSLEDNPQSLWTLVEATEIRKDAQIARKCTISLPQELTLQQNIRLAQHLAKEMFTKHGMVAHFAIHPPSSEGDHRNIHVHFQITMRRIGFNGFEKKERTWNLRSTLLKWREQWADIVNLHLERNGYSSRIDHRSLKKQGLAREPTIPLGPRDTYLERKGIRTRRGDINREIRVRNLKRAFPQSTYTNSSMQIDRMHTSPANTLPPQSNYYQDNFSSTRIDNSRIRTELMTQIQYSTAPPNSTLPSLLIRDQNQNITTITLPDALPILLRHHNPVIFPDQNGQSEQQRKWAQRLARDKREIAIRHIKHAIHFNRPILHEDLNKLNRQDLYGLIMHGPEHFRSPPKHNNTQRQIGFER